ncbi:TPA: helix-turn-helix domain-containing protein [Escherichia coli]|nr:helix-turn-helix domain-containing protein [Escherichia coli]
MSHPIINVGRYHGGSDDWRSPFASCVLIYRNTPRKPKVEVTQTIYCGDTMLLLAVVNRGGLRGRPHIHDAQTLDRLIKMHNQGQSVKSIAESLRMPLSTTYRIVQRLG